MCCWSAPKASFPSNDSPRPLRMGSTVALILECYQRDVWSERIVNGNGALIQQVLRLYQGMLGSFERVVSPQFLRAVRDLALFHTNTYLADLEAGRVNLRNLSTLVRRFNRHWARFHLFFHCRQNPFFYNFRAVYELLNGLSDPAEYHTWRELLAEMGREFGARQQADVDSFYTVEEDSMGSLTL